MEKNDSQKQLFTLNLERIKTAFDEIGHYRGILIDNFPEAISVTFTDMRRVATALLLKGK